MVIGKVDKETTEKKEDFRKGKEKGAHMKTKQRDKDTQSGISHLNYQAMKMRQQKKHFPQSQTK